MTYLCIILYLLGWPMILGWHKDVRPHDETVPSNRFWLCFIWPFVAMGAFFVLLKGDDK